MVQEKTVSDVELRKAALYNVLSQLLGEAPDDALLNDETLGSNPSIEQLRGKIPEERFRQLTGGEPNESDAEARMEEIIKEALEQNNLQANEQGLIELKNNTEELSESKNNDSEVNSVDFHIDGVTPSNVDGISANKEQSR